MDINFVAILLLALLILGYFATRHRSPSGPSLPILSMRGIRRPTGGQINMEVLGHFPPGSAGKSGALQVRQGREILPYSFNGARMRIISVTPGLSNDSCVCEISPGKEASVWVPAGSLAREGARASLVLD